MVGRPAKKNVMITLDEDDYLWARLHGVEFSQEFGKHLKMIRTDVEVASYGLILSRVPQDGSKKNT